MPNQYCCSCSYHKALATTVELCKRSLRMTDTTSGCGLCCLNLHCCNFAAEAGKWERARAKHGEQQVRLRMSSLLRSSPARHSAKCRSEQTGLGLPPVTHARSQHSMPVTHISPSMPAKVMLAAKHPIVTCERQWLVSDYITSGLLA